MGTITFNEANTATVHRISDVDGSAVSGFPLDVEPVLKAHALTLPEVSGEADYAGSKLRETQFSADATEMFALWELDLNVSPFDIRILLHYDLEADQIIGTPKRIDTTTELTGNVITPVRKSPGNLSTLLAGGYYADNRFRYAGLDRGTENLLYSLDAAGVPLSSGTIVPATPSEDSAVFAGAIDDNSDGNPDLPTLFYFNQDGTGVTRGTVTKTRGYRALIPVGSGAALKLIGIPNGGQSFGSPLAGAETIEVYDNAFNLISSHQILSYNSVNIQNELNSVQVDEALGVLYLGFWASFNPEATNDVILQLADLDNQKAVPNSGRKHGQLSADGTQICYYDEGLNAFTIVEVETGTDVATVNLPVSPFELDSFSYPTFYQRVTALPEIPPFWTSFVGTDEVLD